MNTRCHVVKYHGNNRATFQCPEGHQWKANLVTKRRGLPLPGETGLRLMASWWAKGKGGVSMRCPACTKAEGKRPSDVDLAVAAHMLVSGESLDRVQEFLDIVKAEGRFGLVGITSALGLLKSTAAVMPDDGETPSLVERIRVAVAQAEGI